MSETFSHLAARRIHAQVLFELILAANYLDIKSLLDLTCAKVASMIKGKNTEEIRIMPCTVWLEVGGCLCRLVGEGPGASSRQAVQHRERLHP